MNISRSKTDSAFIVLFCLILGFIIFALASVSEASDVTLTWEKPDDSRVVGYNIYFWEYNQDRSTATEILVVGPDTTSVLIPGLSEGQTYNFSARSKADNDMLSDWSETIDYIVPIYIPKRPETLIINFGE